MKTYRNKKWLPLPIAAAYLRHEHKAISKIKNFYVDFDGWPETIENEKNNNYTFLGEALVKELSLQKLFEELKDNEELKGNKMDLIELELLFTPGKIYPKEEASKFEDSINITGNVSIGDVLVLKKEVYEIVKKWNLLVDDSALDTQIPDQEKNQRLLDIPESNPYKDRYLEKENAVLGAALAIAVLAPNLFLDKKKKVTATYIYRILSDYAPVFWPVESKVPVEVRTGTGYIKKYLNKVLHLSTANFTDEHKLRAVSLLKEVINENRIDKKASEHLTDLINNQLKT